MVTQQIFLPMIPDSAPIVVNISQYDFDAAGYAGRLFFNLVSDGVAYDMDGATAVFQGEKPDGTMFAYPATIVNASVVRVNVRQQMTAVAGRVICQLILSNTDGQIGSFNIWLEVQASSGSGSDPSQTDIPALIAQAKEYRDEAEQAAIDAGAWSANPPYIGANGNWFVYDIDTTSYTDTGVYAAGTEGNLWYSGTAISGKDPTPTVYPTGIATARQGDMYLNKTEGAIYQCTLGGAPTVAKWAYVMTLTGGGGGGTSDYPDLDNKPQINGVTLVGNKSAHDFGLQNELVEGTNITIDPVTNEISATTGVTNAFDEVVVGGVSLVATDGDTLTLTAGANVTLTPNASTNTLEISATGGGGGSSTFAGLSDTDITSPQADQIVQYKSVGGQMKLQNVDMPFTLLPTTNDIATITALQNGNDNYVINAYSAKRWSNTDSITLLTTVAQGDDTMGTWTDTWETDGDRSGWLCHSLLADILSDNDTEIELVFDIADSETVSAYAYRIDDHYTVNGETVGGIAIKFNGAIQNASGVKVGVKLKHNRATYINVSRT